MANPQGEIRGIAWQAIHLWIRELAADQDMWDCIVGVSRGGLPLAVSLSCGRRPARRSQYRQPPRRPTANTLCCDGQTLSAIQAHSFFRIRSRQTLAIGTGFGDPIHATAGHSRPQAHPCGRRSYNLRQWTAEGGRGNIEEI